jgi:antitoxin component YwqK of YwqJK toxin-antitoxin module
MKKLALFLLIVLLPLFCNSQKEVKEYIGDINIKDIIEIKGLIYFKADTSLVTGRVIRFNKKKVAKKYFFVSQGKQEYVGWVYFKDKVEMPEESGLGSLLSIPVYMFGNNIFLGNEDYNDYNSLNRTESYLSYQKEYTSKAYHDMLERNAIYTRLNSSKDIMNGSFETYYEDGQIRMKGTYKDGKVDGGFEEYYDNGQLKSKRNYKEGKINGEWVNYYKNGKLRAKGRWKKGNINGEWVEYNENGQVIRKGSWKDGEWIEYDENGQVIKK